MGPRRADDELAGGDDTAGRPGRRLLGWLVGLVVLGGLLVVVRPDLTLHGDPPRREPGASSTPALDQPQTIVAWDPRGDLGHDRRFVSDAVRRIRQDRPGVARVYLAAALPDGSRVALGGTDSPGGVVATAVHAMLLRPGQRLADATVTDVGTLSDLHQVVAWAHQAENGHVYVAVFCRPGPVRFQVSARVEFDPAGRPSRTWRQVLSEDGSAVVDLGLHTDPSVAVRARGPDVLPSPGLVPVLAGRWVPQVVRVAGVGDPAYAGPATPLLVDGLRRSLGGLVDLSTVTPRVLWSGAPWRQRRLALVLVTRPDGVRLQTLVGAEEGAAFGVGVRALPRDAADGVPWLLEPFGDEDPTLLLCPPGAGTLLYRRSGRETRLPIPPSGAVEVVGPGEAAPSARGARVTLLDDAGREVLRTTLPAAGPSDPLALGSG